MKTVYAMFCGLLDEAATGRILNSIAKATQEKVEHAHLLFQSDGVVSATELLCTTYLRRFHSS